MPSSGGLGRLTDALPQAVSREASLVRPHAVHLDCATCILAGGLLSLLDDRRRKTERGLLKSLRTHRTALTELLEECSGHWGLDDPVYRFYHQSFKVYWVQERTLRIVKALEQIMPERRLNSWFREIDEQGTGKVFAPSDNKNWTAITRPIIEAYLHARFFLDVAVRSADIPEPPYPLPSDYAALLYLYDMR